jgi:hypothetical protein
VVVNAYIFSALASAAACAPVVDAQQGYPRPGFNVGGGLHVPGPFVTVTYAVPLAHPTLPEWAYVADVVTQPALSPDALLLSLPVPVLLDASWFPVAQVTEAVQAP